MVIFCIPSGFFDYDLVGIRAQLFEIGRNRIDHLWRAADVEELIELRQMSFYNEVKALR